MKIYIEDLGDNRDGKHANTMTIRLSWDVQPLTKGEREALRRIFWNFAVGALSFDIDNTSVTYEDECLLCGKKLVKGLCKNVDCADYIPDELEIPRSDLNEYSQNDRMA